MTPQTVSEIYDVVNDFESATKERSDNKGNQSIIVVKGGNGTSYAILIERGKNKAQVRTAYKKKGEQVLDVTSPKPNVRNDPALSSTETIPQSEEQGKENQAKNSTTAEFENNDTAMIKAVLDAPVGTKIEFDSTFGDKSYYTITMRGGDKKMLTEVDENGNRTSRQSLILNRENVKKFLGGRRLGKDSEILRTGTIKLTYPKTKLAEDKKVERTKLEGANGRKAFLNLGNGEKIQVRYRVVEAEDLTASNFADGSINDAYPDEGLQPRNRSTQVMIDQMQNIAKKPNADLLLDQTNSLNNGAPVVRSDGIVLNGNGRIAGVQESYNLEKTENRKNIDEYRKEILAQAEDFGLDIAEVEKIKNPVLVREVTEELSNEELRKVTGNTEGGAKLNPEERAKADADKLVPNDFFGYQRGLKKDLKAEKNYSFVVKILNKIATAEERSAYFDSNNNLTSKGEERVRQALLYFAFRSEKLIANSATLNPVASNLQSAIENNAAIFAKLKADMFSAKLPSYDLSVITDAAEEYFSLKRQGKKISDYLKENKFEDSKDSTEKQKILQAFDQYANKPLKLQEFLNNIEELIRRQSSQYQGVKNNALNFEEIINSAKNQVDNPSGDFTIEDEETDQETEYEDETSDGGLFSAEGETSATLQEIQKNLVADENLTSQQKTFVEWGKSIKMPVKWFKAEKNFFGYHGEDGVSYFNVNAKADLERTFYHETAHWLAENNRTMFNQILDVAEITDAQRQAKRNSASVYKNLSDAKLNEEILADNFEDIAKRSMLLQKIGKSDKSLLDKVISYLKAMLDKFASYFHNPKGGLTNTQWNKMYGEFVKNIRELKDGYGNRYYRVNNRTHEVEHFSGGLLGSYSFAGEKAKTANLETLKQAKKLEKQGKNRDEIFEETGWFKGKDNKWRFEIPDNLDKIDFSKLKGEYNSAFLSEIYDNPALYAAYPELKIIAVSANKNMSDQTYGEVSESVWTGEPFIKLNYKYLDQPNFKKTLVHEIQHVIQGYEDFAVGGNPKNVRKLANDKIKPDESDFEAYERLGGEQESREVEGRTKLKELLNEAEKEVKEAKGHFEKQLTQLTPHEKELLEDYRELYKVKPDSHSTNLKEKFEWYEKRRSFKDKLPNEVLEAYDNFESAKSVVKDFQSAPTPHDDDAIIVFGGKNYSLSAKNSVDKAQNLSDNTTDKILFTRYIGKRKQDLQDSIKIDVARAKREGKNVVRDELPTINRLIDTLNATPKTDAYHINREMYAAQIEFARRYFENEFGRNADSINENNRSNSSDRRRATSPDDRLQRNTSGESKGTVEKVESAGETILNVDGEKDDAKKLWRKMYENEQTRHSESRGAFSYAPDDNSSESLTQKIKSSFNSFINGDEPLHQQRIKNLLKKLSNYKIAAGQLHSKAPIVIDHIQKVIRTKREYDWQRILPEVGGLVAEQLNLKTTPEMSNYIADWLMTGAPNNTSTEAKDFQAAMRKNPELAKILTETQLEFLSDNQLSAMEKAQRSISFKERKAPLSERFLKWKKDFYAHWVESLEPVNELVKNVEEITKTKIKDALNPFVAFRLYRGSSAKAMTLIEGNENAVGALKTLYPSVDFDGFKTINMILEKVGAVNNEKRQKDFATYAVACHMKDIHLHNHALDSQIKELENKIENESDKAKIKKFKEEIKSLKAETIATPKDFSEKNCDEIISKYQAEFGEAQQDLVRYSQTVLAIYVDSGLMSYKKYQELVTKWKNYVPLFRVFDENEKNRFGDSTMKMVGSTRLVINPIESIINNTFNFLKAAEKNKAKCLLANLTRIGGLGELVEEVDASGVNTITYYENGTKKFLQTDESVAKAVNNLDTVQQASWLMKFLHSLMSFVRASMTISNPDFAVGNVLRDSQDAALYSKNGFIPILDNIKGFVHAWNYDKLFWEWQASGAAQSSFVSNDRNYAQYTINKMTKTKTQRFLSHPLDFILESLQAFSEYSEYSTRIGEYSRAKNKLAAERGQAEYGDIITAALSSRDLTDFARNGTAGRDLNSISAFSNAAIQGIDKFHRTFTTGTLKEKSWTLARLAIVGMLPALLQFFIHHDKDWYKELEDWEKNTNRIIAEGVKIPKGMDIGVRFGSSIIEKFLGWAVDKNEFTAKQILKPLKDSLPEWKPTAIMPIIECMANYSFFFERPTVPQKEQNLPAHMQYNQGTSGFAKFLGEESDYSPRKIDHLATGYLGTFFGRQIPRIADSVFGDRKLDTSLTEMPLSRRIFFETFKNPKIISEYYEVKEKQTNLHNEFKQTGKKPEGYDAKLYKKIQANQKKMQKLSKLERQITDNDKLSVEERKQRLKDLQMKKMQLAKKILNKT